MGPRWTGIALIVLACASGALGATWFLTDRRSGSSASALHEPGERIGSASGDDELTRAWKRVVDHSRDAAAWVALGDIQATHDQVDAAEHSYRTAVKISGQGGAPAYARLGFLLYGRGDDSGSLALLAEAKRRGAEDPMLDFTIRTIKERSADAPVPLDKKRQAADEPASLDGGASADAPGQLDAATPPAPDAGAIVVAGRDPPSSAAVAPHEPVRADMARQDSAPASGATAIDPSCYVPVARVHERGGFMVDAELAGVGARLMIDTGATISVISRDLLSRIGGAKEERQIRVLTANGPTTMALVRIPTIDLGGRTAESMLVGVCDDCMRGIADGLFGLDLQATFGLELELQNSRVRFADCGQ